YIAIQGIDDCGAVAGSPHSLDSRDRHIWIHNNTTPELRHWNLVEQYIRLSADRANNGTAFNDVAARDLDTTIRHALGTRSYPDIDATPAHLPQRKRLQRCG